MNDKKKLINSINDKNEEKVVQPDTLDLAGVEVATISDGDLAQQFLQTNTQANTESKAIFSSTDLYEEKISIIKPNAITEELYQKTILRLKNEAKINELLVEDYYQKKFKNLWFRTKQFFVGNRVYRQDLTYQYEDPLWKTYEKWQNIKRKQKNVYYNDFLTYSGIQLRNPKKVKLIWGLELFFSLLFIISSIIGVVLITLLPIVYTGTETRYLNLFNLLKTISFSLGIVNIILVLIPYFFLVTTWFVSINQVQLSKYFHYFLIIFLTIVFLLLFVQISLLISYYSYSFYVWNLS